MRGYKPYICTNHTHHIYLQNLTDNVIEKEKFLGENASWGKTPIISSLTAKPTNLKPKKHSTNCMPPNQKKIAGTVQSHDPFTF